MNSRQLRTLAAVFAHPTSATIEWSAIESLLVAAGCTTIEGSGSRVRFNRGEIADTFHCLHSDEDAKRYQVRAAALFLTRLGVEP